MDCGYLYGMHIVFYFICLRDWRYPKPHLGHWFMGTLGKFAITLTRLANEYTNELRLKDFKQFSQGLSRDWPSLAVA